jgi:hypothetical protein
MRAILAAVIVASSIGPAYSQAMGIPLDDGKAPPTQEQRDREKVRDDAYKSATDKIPNQKAASDPWGDVRGATQTPQKKSKN